MLFDKTFSVDIDERKHFSNSSIITLSTKLQRKIQIRVHKGVDEWLENFNKITKKSPWTGPNRYESFAPVRKNVKIKWFVDGHGKQQE